MPAPALRRCLLVFALLLAQWGAYAHALEHAATEPHGACALCVHGQHDSDAPVTDDAAAPVCVAVRPRFVVKPAVAAAGALPPPPIRDPPAAARG